MASCCIAEWHSADGSDFQGILRPLHPPNFTFTVAQPSRPRVSAVSRCRTLRRGTRANASKSKGIRAVSVEFDFVAHSGTVLYRRMAFGRAFGNPAAPFSFYALRIANPRHSGDTADCQSALHLDVCPELGPTIDSAR